MGICWARSSAFAVFSLLLAAPAWAAGQLVLDTTPPGAAVILNGQPIGETPFVHERLQAGTHQLTLSRPGYQSVTLRVTIQNDLTTRQRVTMTPERRPPSGELVVESMPAGADVYLNGRWLGKTPLHVPVAAGTHRLSLRHPGYEASARTVRVVSDLTTTQRLTLSAIAPTPPSAVAARPKPEPIPTAEPPPPPPSPTPEPTTEPTMTPTPEAMLEPSPRATPEPTPTPTRDKSFPPGRVQAPASQSHVASDRSNPGNASPHPRAAARPEVVAPLRPPPRHMPRSTPPAPHESPPESLVDSPPALPVDWAGHAERARHAGFSLMMLGFVATLGHALWRQRAKPLDWQPDSPSADFHLLPELADEVGRLAAQATRSAILRAELGNWTQALADLGEAFRLLPSAGTAYNLALGWELTGMPDWAEVAYRTAIHLDPDHRDAGLNLANLCVVQGKSLDAGVIFRALVKRHAEDGAIAYNHGNLLASLGQLGPALSELKRARRLMPSDPSPAINLRLLRRQKAAELWARALRRGPRAR